MVCGPCPVVSSVCLHPRGAHWVQRSEDLRGYCWCHPAWDQTLCCLNPLLMLSPWSSHSRRASCAASSAPFVSALAGDTLLRWAGPVLCGTNSLCNMSTDKLAGNYRRRRSLLSRRGRGASPYGALWIAAWGIFLFLFFPQWNSKQWHLKRITKFPPIGILMRPGVLFLGERHASRSLVTADVIAVIEFQKVDHWGGQSGTVDLRGHQKGGRKKKEKKNRHIFVRDKRDSVPFFFFFLFHENWWIQILLLQELSAETLEKHVRQKESRSRTFELTEHSHSPPPALSWVFWCFLYRPTRFSSKFTLTSNFFFFFFKQMY